MNRMRQTALLLLGLLLMTLSIVVSAQDGMTVDTLRVRSGPGTDNPILARIPPRSDVMIEGRNDTGNWILVHTSDGGVRGWVPGRTGI